MNLVFRLWWLRLRARRRGQLSVWDVARTPFRVLPTDLDLLFHMNNGKYLSILDLG
ncbi:MAG: thioesterase, partial [Actinobacteria bacterium]|nr:thioesterase [Actinomycetota bacterium]